MYNNPNGIELLIHSLNAQNYPKDLYDILIIDNKSNDETVKVIKNNITNLDNFNLYSENYRSGSYAARNKGIKLSMGKILAFTDSDCVPLNDWISEGVKKLQTSSYNCGGGKINFTFQGQKPNIHEKFDSQTKLNQEFYITNLHFAATANLFIRREVFENIGYFNAELISSGDLEFGQRLKNNNEQIVYIPNAVVNHPARSTFRENYIKSIRLAIGRKQTHISDNKTTLDIKNRKGIKLYRSLSVITLIKILIIDIKSYIKIII